eukprot:m.330853 g.330853  ORF g.330853 m.330853 type:complete len:480 (+) comp20463_c1_seq26:777-2216(+)
MSPFCCIHESAGYVTCSSCVLVCFGGSGSIINTVDMIVLLTMPHRRPDHNCNSKSKFKANIDCDLQSWLGYFDACAQGLKEVNPNLLWGGPGAGAAMMSTPFLTAMLQHVSTARENGSNSTALDFVQWHEKGVATNTAADVAIVAHIRNVSPAIAATIITGNEEVDPLGGWNKVVEWRGDSTYPAAVSRILNMHQHALRENETDVIYAYHSNDNSFLNYGDAWFDQRTLVVRFLMNETGATEVLRKPILNVMALLSLMGTRKYHVTGSPDPQQSPFGIMVTSRTSPTEAHELEISVLMYNADGVTNNCTAPACDVNASVTLHGLSEWISRASLKNRWRVSSVVQACITHFRIDQTHGNPRALWTSFGGPSNPYPSPEQFALMRNATEIDVLERRFLTLPTSSTNSSDVSPLPLTLSTILPQPAVSMFHVCILTTPVPDIPSAAHSLAARVTPTLSPPTVFLRWRAPVCRTFGAWSMQHS